MFSVWTRHLKDQEDKERFERSLRSSSWILEHLSTAILSKMESDLDNSERSLKTYELPNWDVRQAHNNGYRQALSLVQKIINLDHEETNDRRPTSATPGRPNTTG